jgi:hypothetical protein
MSKTATAFLLIPLVVFLAADAAFADHIGIYGDPVGSSCTSALAQPPTVNNAYVIHKYTVGTTGVRFKVNDQSGLFHEYATTPYLEGGGAGAPYTGSSLAYGNCLNGQLLIYTLGFLWFGQPISCGPMSIVQDPLEPMGIVAFDCNFAPHLATRSAFYWNPAVACWDCPLPATEATTWGKVKALYR